MRTSRSERAILLRWILFTASTAAGIYIARRRGKLVLAALSAFLTERALKALADVFRREAA